MLVFNIIIIALILHTLFSKHNTVLSCGLFAFIGNNANRFNWDRFNYLGAANDDRGGDSCGIVTPDFFKYGMGPEARYEKFIIKADQNPEGKYKIVLGHTRKASIGAVDLNHAQPYIFTSKSRIVKRMKKKDPILSKFVDRNAAKDTLVFAGTHNGTINNYKELASQYGINCLDKNDSGVIMEILFKYGTNVLTEYAGTAALIWHNFAENCSYVFRGSSPIYSKNAVAIEERPLFAYVESDNNTYFSSTEDSLKFIGGNKDSVLEVDANYLYKIQNGKITSKIEVDRSVIPQKESTVTTSSGSRNAYKVNEDLYGSEWSNCHGYGKSNILYQKDVTEEYIGEYKLSKRAISGSKLHIINEVKPYIAAIDTNSIFFWRGRYMFCEVLAQGVIHISHWGKRITPTERGARPFFFIDGVMLVDRTAYEEGLKIIADFKGTEKELARKLAPLSVYPVHSYFKTNERKLDFQDFFKPNDAYVEHRESDSTRVMAGRVHFTGEFNPVFSKRIYIVRNGDLKGISETVFAKTPNEEFGSIENPKNKPFTGKIIAIPQVTEEYPDCPCYNCKDAESNQCTNCNPLDDYLAEWKKFNELPENKRTDNKLALSPAESDVAYDAAYREVYDSQLKTIISDFSQAMQEAIEELYTMGPVDASTELEDIFNVTKNTLINFEDKHLSKF